MTTSIGYTVNTLNDLKAVPDSIVITGYILAVVSVQSWFIYNASGTDTPDNVYIIQPNSGNGRWYKMNQAALVSIANVNTVNSNVSPTVTSSSSIPSKLTFNLPRAASISIGTVTTLSSGSSASVTNVGTNGDVILNIGIPQGQQGIQGNTGLTGATGNAGSTPTLNIGTITTLSAGSNATATLVNNGNNNYILNLGLPIGATGNTGAAPTLSTGTITTLNPSSNATASIVNTSANNYVINLGIPQGLTGNAGANGTNGLTPTLGIGTVTSLSAGSSATASITNTSGSNYVLNLGIPVGNTGATGSTGTTPAISVNNVTSLSAGSTPTVSVDSSSTSTNIKLNFGIPVGLTGATGSQGIQGATGLTPNITIGTVSTLSSGSNATASITGTTPNLILNLGIPQGATGASGSGGSGTSGIINPDIYYPYTSLILNAVGVNSSTNILDSSNLDNLSITNTNLTISNSQSSPGGNYLYFNGSNYIYISSSANFAFNTNDFTVEAFVYVSNFNYYRDFIVFNTTGSYNSANGCAIDFNFTPAGKLNIYTGTNYSGNIVLSVNTLYHIAWSRVNGVLYTFVNGVLDTTLSFNISLGNTTSNDCWIGRNNTSNQYFVGYAKVRVTKGIGRYTTTFTPPTVFSDNSNSTTNSIISSNYWTLLNSNTNLTTGYKYLITANATYSLPSNPSNGNEIIVNNQSGSTIQLLTNSYLANGKVADLVYYNSTWNDLNGNLQVTTSTSLLLHMTGTNGSTTFTDSVVTPHTVNSTNAVISTTKSKFSSSSGYFNGNSYLSTTIDSRLQLATVDFTLEAFVYPTSLSSEQMIISSTPAIPSVGYSLALNGAYIRFESGGSSPGFNSTAYALTVNTWNHIAICRVYSTNIYYMCVNGNAQSISNSAVWSDGTTLYIGSNARLDYPYYFNGYINDVRIIKGTAIYTGNYTVPTSSLTV